MTLENWGKHLAVQAQMVGDCSVTIAQKTGSVVSPHDPNSGLRIWEGQRVVEAYDLCT